MHPSLLSDEELLGQCEFGRGRSSGPGGQHRNKVETEVTLTHRPTGLKGKAGERRSQVENKRVALKRLRLVLAVQVREGVCDGDCRSELWKSRCRGGKISCNPKHADFSALLAEALDVIAAAGFDPKAASVRLECTTSQLIRFVKDHPPAFSWWNKARADQEMHVLH